MNLKFQRKFRIGKFAKNVLTLLTGSTIAQTIPIAVSPILTRLYTPEDFGILALFLAIVSFIAIVITGQYESAIVLPKKDEDAINIFFLSLIITFTISIITLIIVWIFNQAFTQLLNNKDISNWLYFIPIVLILTGMYNTFNFWLTRKRQFKSLAIGRVTMTSGNSGIKIGLGLLTGGPDGLISGAIGGQLIGTGVLGWLLRKDIKNNLKQISKKKISENALKYQDFPKYKLPHGFLDMINQNGIIFIITAFYSFGVLGFYSFSMNILRKPLTLIGSSVAQVFYQKASETYNESKDVWKITKRTLFNLSLIALPIFIIIVFWGPNLFSLIFGEKWKEAGIYAQILSPWLMLKFITSPISIIPTVLNKQKTFLIIGIGYNLIVPLVLLVISFLNYDIEISLTAVSVTASLYTLGVLYWISKISKGIKE